MRRSECDSVITQSILYFTVIVQSKGNTLKNTILAHLYHLNNTMTINEPKLSCIWFIYLESIVWRLVVCDLNFKGRLRFYGNLVGTPSKTLQDPRKSKTVTPNDYILGIYGTNINDFKALPYAFPSRWFNPTFACPWRAENVPSNFEFISYRNNLRRRLSIYFNKTRPLLNRYSKRRLAAMF